MSNKIIRLAVICGASIVLLGAVIAFLRTHFFCRDLTYENIVTRGGIGVSTPVQVASDRWFLPVKIDVSGRRKITHEPQHLDSMASINDVRIEIKERKIMLSVNVSTFPLEWKEREYYGVYLQGNMAGEYEIIYSEKGNQQRLESLSFVPMFPTLGSQTPPSLNRNEPSGTSRASKADTSPASSSSR